MAGTNRNISVRAVGDFSNLSQGLQRAQSEIQSFGDRVKSKFKEIGEVGLGLFEVFTVFKEMGEVVGELANRAAELDGGMSSLNRTLGQSAVGYMDWANSTAKSFGISKMSAIEYGKSIAMLLGDVYTNQKQLAQATEQLMQGGAVIAAKTGKSQQEVYEELNSALMGHAAAVKSLDINIMENALVHSQAYKQIANGAPWAKLSVAQQQYIRVTELNRQIQKKFGDTIGNGMDARLMLFKASLDNIQTALAQAFMPILYKVLPILTTFMNWIQASISYVGEFFQALFGYSGIQAGATGAINQHAQAVNALGNAYSTAGNKAASANKALSGGSGGTKKGKTNGLNKNGTASFDQVHTLSTSSSSGGAGGGSGGGGASSLPTPDIPTPDPTKSQSAWSKVSDSVKKFADNVKNWLKPLKPYWDDLVNSVKNLGQSLVNLWNSSAVQAFIKWLASATQWTIGAVLYTLSGLIQGVADSINVVADLLNGNWSKAWSDVKKLVDDLNQKFGVFSPFIAGIGAALGTWLIIGTITKLMETWRTVTESLTAAQIALSAAMDANPVGLIIIAVAALVALIVEVITHWNEITKAFKEFGSWFNKAVVVPIENFSQAAANYLGNLGKKIWGWVTSGWDNVTSWFTRNVTDNILGAFNGLRSLGSHIWSWITSGLGGIGSWFTRYVVNPIHSAFHGITSGLGGAIESGFKYIYDKAADFLNRFINDFNRMKDRLPFGLGGAIPNIPTIPHLANGGITNGPMLAMIGDNPGGQEVVSPLDKLAGMITSSMIHVMQMTKGNNSNNAGGDIILNIDGRTFARIIKPYADLENKRVGTNVRLQSI